MNPFGYGTPGLPLPRPLPSGPAQSALELPKVVIRSGETTLWSTLYMVGATALANSENVVFATPIDGVGQGFVRPLSIAETNIKVGSQVPDGAAYDVWGVSAYTMMATVGDDAAGTTLSAPWNDTSDAAAVTTLINFQYNCVARWLFQQSLIDIAPLALIGGGGGVFGPVAVQANASTKVGSLNNGAGGLWLYAQSPVLLPANTTFNIVLAFGNRAAAAPTLSVAIRVALSGSYRAAVDQG